ncbi:MAG: hypothetical protein AB1634_07100 [Thermodesulfobacteriota bacterium]
MSPPRMLFVDRLCLWSLVPVLWHGRSAAAIVRFEEPERSAGVFLATVRALGLLRAQERLVTSHIGQVVDQDGCCVYVSLQEEARRHCRQLRRDLLERSPFLATLARRWQHEKLVLYFERLAEQWLTREFLRLGLVEWLLGREDDVRRADALLLVRRSCWFLALQRYAAARNIRLQGYGPNWDPDRAGRVFDRAVPTLRRGLASLPRFLTRVVAGWGCGARKGRECPDGLAQLPAPTAVPTVAVHNYHRTLSLRPEDRSGLFWAAEADVGAGYLLVYGYTSEAPLSPEVRTAFHSGGLRIVGRGPDVVDWRPRPAMLVVLGRELLAVLWAAVASLGPGSRVPAYLLFEAASLAFEYSYWLDFFQGNRVAVNVTPDNVAAVGQVLALDHLGGATISYQYSLSNIVAPSTALVAGENVQFVFSSRFREQRQRLRGANDWLVNMGFVHGGVRRLVEANPRIEAVRRGLEAQGARHILCFLDENSVDRWYIRSSHAVAAADYRFLLEWLLDEPTLGVVFKPKKSTDLFQRLASLGDLLERARDTGRAVFLTSDTLVGNIYPTEAALMADAVVGLLNGGTAALEAALAGIPTALIDATATLDHPFYAWGRGRVVFREWPAFRSAFEAYCADPDRCPGFGDWTPGLDDIDPFRDGNAAGRLGSFIRWTHEALRDGATQQTALATAAQRFATVWGQEHVWQDQDRRDHA